MKARRWLTIAAGVAGVLAIILILVMPASPRIGFSVLRYTNDVSGVVGVPSLRSASPLFALVQIANTGPELSYLLHTEVLTNGSWGKSSNQPPFGAFPPYGAWKGDLIRSDAYNVYVPVPCEGTTWRVELEVEPRHRSAFEQMLMRLCYKCNVTNFFVIRKVVSQQFKR